MCTKIYGIQKLVRCFYANRNLGTFTIPTLFQLFVKTGMSLEQYRLCVTFSTKKQRNDFMPGTGVRRCSVDLPQGGMEVPCTLTFVGQSQYIKKVQKLIALVPAKSIEPPPPKKLKAEALVIVEDEVEDKQTSTSGTNP